MNDKKINRLGNTLNMQNNDHINTIEISNNNNSTIKHSTISYHKDNQYQSKKQTVLQ